MRETKKIYKKIICPFFVVCMVFTNAQSATQQKEVDNAALFYYQALLLWPKPDSNDKVTFLVLDEVAKGADPNESVKKYLNLPESRVTIELVQEAAQIPLCDWGPLYPGGYGHGVLAPSLQRFSRFMQVYAHNLAAEGDFRSAFENCIGIQRFAGHIGGETFLMFAVSRMVNGRALTSIRLVLGSVPPDVETLTWLKGHLVPSNVLPSRIIKILRSNCNLHLLFMHDHPKAYLPWWEEYPEAIEDPNAKKKILECANKLYNKHLESTLKILESDLPYAGKKAELQKLINKIEYKADSNDCSIILGDCIPYIESCYNIMVRDVANFNALTVALEIYLINARTGQIPEILPDNQAKDPFSDEDFEYKVTDEGFALRYRDDSPWKKSRWIDFKVKVKR